MLAVSHCWIILICYNDVGDNMNKLALLHFAKSEFAYAYDEKTLHILLRSAKNDLKRVTLIWGDPFSWKNQSNQDTGWVHEKSVMIKRYESRDFDYYFAEIRPPFLRSKYAFLIDDGMNTYLMGPKRIQDLSNMSKRSELYDLSEYYNFPYLNHEDLHQTPTWVKDTIWYQIFMDRFYAEEKTSKLPWGKLPVHNHELYGGNIKGVIKKLDYLHDLGINGIYFTPIFKAPSAHKYDTIDYFQIDPQFGTNEDFKLLVQEAHKRGIKVMLDGVFNHSGYDHPFFQDVIKHGKDSKYSDCFFITDYPVVNFPLNGFNKPMNTQGITLNYKTFAHTPYMPKWNTSNPIANEYLLNVVKYWIEEYDIDGWRLDVSNEISHDFLRQIRLVSRNTKKDTFILGENWDSSLPWLRGDQMDSVMNYDLSIPLWKYLEHKIDLETFKDMVENYLALTPKNVIENMFNLVGSHDTIRIKRRLLDDSRRVKLAYLIMFLSAGAPNIYYGDEIGLTGEHDPDNRRTMTWDSNDQDLDFFLFVKKLIELRKKYQVFSAPDYDFIDFEVLAFEKKDKKDRIIVILGDEKEHIIHVTTDLVGRYKNLFTDVIIELRDTIKLRSYEYMVLREVS